MDEKSLSHTSWNCKYHIVLVPKYRRKTIYGKLRKNIGKILRMLCDYKHVEIIEAHAIPAKENARLKIRRAYCKSNHLKMPQCLHDRILFLLRTLRLLCILVFRFMVILSLDDTVLLLHLCDIEIGDLQRMMLPHIILNLVVSRLALCGSHIQLVHADVHFDMPLDMEFGQKENRFHMTRHLQIDVIIVHFSGSFWGTMQCRLEEKGRGEQRGESF